MSGRTLFEEVWECRFPKRQTVEEDLLALQTLAPDRIEDLRALFKEAVTYSLASLLGDNEARALVRSMGEASFESPPEMFATLDSLLREGSQALKASITEEFRLNLHLLLEKTKTNTAARCGTSY